MEPSETRNNGETEDKKKPVQILLQWGIGLLFLYSTVMATVNALFKPSITDVVNQDIEIVNRNNQLIAGYRKDSTLSKDIEKQRAIIPKEQAATSAPPVISSSPSYTAPVTIDTSPITQSPQSAAESNEPERTPPAPKLVNIEGDYVNLDNDAIWSFKQNGNNVTWVVTKSKGTEKGDGEGYIDGTTLIVKEYRSNGFWGKTKSDGELLILNEGTVLNGTLTTKTGNVSLPYKLDRK